MNGSAARDQRFSLLVFFCFFVFLFFFFGTGALGKIPQGTADPGIRVVLIATPPQELSRQKVIPN